MMPDTTKADVATAWHSLLESRDLSSEERRLLELLAQGKTQAGIAAQLGMHRSAVWRRVNTLRKRAKAVSGENL